MAIMLSVIIQYTRNAWTFHVKVLNSTDVNQWANTAFNCFLREEVKSDSGPKVCADSYGKYEVGQTFQNSIAFKLTFDLLFHPLQLS